MAKIPYDQRAAVIGQVMLSGDVLCDELESTGSPETFVTRWLRVVEDSPETSKHGAYKAGHILTLTVGVSDKDVSPVVESKRTQFLRVMRTELAKYPWASEPDRLDRTMASVEGTMSGDRRCIINGASWLAAWKAIGQKGKPTYKALHALFAS